MKDYPAVHEYMQHIPDHDLLSAETEAALFQQMHDAQDPRESKAARDALVGHNYRLVVSIATEMLSCTTMAFEDIVQQGMEGLLIAVDRFQPEYDQDTPARFSTYAFFWIRREVRRAVSDYSRTVRVPAHVHDRMAKLRAAESVTPEGTPIEKISELSDLEPEVVEDLRLVGQPIGSLNIINLEDESWGSVQDMLQADHIDMVNLIHRKRQEERLRSVLDVLPNRSRYVIVHRMGLGVAEQTHKDIGDHLGISKQRVKQIEDKALEQMRAAF